MMQIPDEKTIFGIYFSFFAETAEATWDICAVYAKGYVTKRAAGMGLLSSMYFMSYNTIDHPSSMKIP